MANKAKIIALLTIISICQTPLILVAFGIDIGGILTIILTECLMMLLIGFLARSHYWSQDSIKANEGHVAGSLPSAQAPSNTISVDEKLVQFAFNKLDKEQKAELLGKFIKKIKRKPYLVTLLYEKPESVGYIKVLKDALDIMSKSENVANISSEDEISKSENVANKCSDIEYKYSDYLNMYNFIDGNKKGGFGSSRVLGHQALIINKP